MFFRGTQGEDRVMSASEGIQERTNQGEWVASSYSWDDTPNLYMILNVLPGCTKPECDRARK